jgi:uncharacterized integral membrane protein (TIGR00697 family)
MDNDIVTPLIELAQRCFDPGSYTLIYLLLIGFLALLNQCIFGVLGLYSFNILVILAANIQVLGMAKFVYIQEPIALGIVTSAITFLVSDIITEHYGYKKARVGLWLGFAAQITFTVVMVTGMGYNHVNKDVEHAIGMVFTPSPRLVVASIGAYMVSQYIDITIFHLLAVRLHSKYLWARTVCTSLIAGFADIGCFSVLAWHLLASKPVTWHKLFYVYIIPNFVMRLIVQALSVPFIYLSYAAKYVYEARAGEGIPS